MIPRAARCDQKEMRALRLAALAHDATKLALVLQSILPTEATYRRLRHFGTRLRRGQRVETVRRKRPLARRRLITARPFLVAMRARNPCVRTRLVLLGLRSPFFTESSKSPGRKAVGTGAVPYSLRAAATMRTCSKMRITAGGNAANCTTSAIRSGLPITTRPRRVIGCRSRNRGEADILDNITILHELRENCRDRRIVGLAAASDRPVPDATSNYLLLRAVFLNTKVPQACLRHADNPQPARRVVRVRPSVALSPPRTGPRAPTLSPRPTVWFRF